MKTNLCRSCATTFATFVAQSLLMLKMRHIRQAIIIFEDHESNQDMFIMGQNRKEATRLIEETAKYYKEHGEDEIIDLGDTLQ